MASARQLVSVLLMIIRFLRALCGAVFLVVLIIEEPVLGHNAFMQSVRSANITKGPIQ
jgi:hypothetical protein